VIAAPVIILVGLLAGLMFNSVRNTNDIATMAYQQQHQQQPATSADSPRPEPGR